MLAISYRSRALQQASKNDFIRQLKKRTELENFYMYANHKAALRQGGDPNAKLRFLAQSAERSSLLAQSAERSSLFDANNPNRPVRGKDTLTPDEIEMDLKGKLAPFMLNNRELNAFVADQKAAGTLSQFDDLFDLFKSKYLVGVTRLNNAAMRNLYASFVARTL